MEEKALVGVIMGSQSDWPETMKHTAITLQQLGVSFEVNIVSAHRTPERLFEYAKTAKERGLKVIIAGAGGAAHLPGMIASLTTLPVLGVPVQSKSLSGMDSLLSIVQMPGGIPVGTLAIGRAGAINAAILATSILATSGNYPNIEEQLNQFRRNQTDSVALIPHHEEPFPSLEIKSSFLFGREETNIDTKDKKQNETERDEIAKENRKRKQDMKPIPSGRNVGIIGGGQLAKMSAMAAASLGYKVWIFAPENDPPASHSCFKHFKGDYMDKEALEKFASQTDVITYEFENIPKETLEYLNRFTPVRPSPHVNATCQDRLMEKTFVKSLGIPTAPFEPIRSKEELKEALIRISYPAVLKSNNFGYDGKGQFTLRSESDIDKAWEKMQSVHSQSAILEGFISFEKEVSVIVGRDLNGNVECFPLVENEHENHILKKTTVPAHVSEQTKENAKTIATKLANEFQLVGILAVEMFVTKDGSLLVNEMAPRPHNSGHWSIEASNISQFDQHVRSVVGLDVGKIQVIAPHGCHMINLLGNEVNQWVELISSGYSVHLYGKDEIKPGRKLGHATKFDS
eukprot:TRINITY_DN5164_c0_g1_i2.p1 TRINITY_DN5164_c0_g1~~TRINITY_DN5164_c0_g1_i2.p1  ORF type:complete len:572 (+),score=169.12 TRINITY_DN5164_c0_g1_i2:121-1836(+)